VRINYFCTHLAKSAHTSLNLHAYVALKDVGHGVSVVFCLKKNLVFCVSDSDKS